MRLFVAINLPADERERLLAAATTALREQRLPVRWSAPSSLHLTVKFLGEVAGERVEEISGSLERAASGVRRFALELGGGGVFPNRTRPAIWWVGVKTSAELTLLQRRVEHELGTLGFEPDERAFSPHLTIGRTQRQATGRGLRTAAEWLQALAYGSTINVESVDLMHSQLASTGARYQRLYAARLGS